MHGGGAPAGAHPGGMTGEEDAPVVRAHPLFVVVFWVSLLLFAVTVVWVAIAISPHPHVPPPRPVPWSCEEELKKIALVDGGGQIAPVCGQSPYPDAPSGG